MTIEWKTAVRAGLGVVTLLAACDGGTGEPASSSRPEPNEPPEEASPAAPDEQRAVEGTDPGQGTASVPDVRQQSFALVRRAELREVETVVSPTLDPGSALTGSCSAPARVAGQLDTDSHFVETGPFGWLVDAFVVTAL